MSIGFELGKTFAFISMFLGRKYMPLTTAKLRRHVGMVQPRHILWVALKVKRKLNLLKGGG